MLLSDYFKIDTLHQKLFYLKLDKLKIIQSKASRTSSFLVSLSKKLYGPAQISLNYIKSWCIEKSIIQNDPDECFVANFYIKDDDADPLFRLFVTTKNLMKNCLNSNHVCADAAYNLIWQDYPILMVGTTDKQCAFHPFGIALCINEKTNDFEFMFKSVQLAVEQLYNINYCPIIFVADASGTITNGCPLINNFIDYFTNEWHMSNKGWFVGFAIGYPSSNNALQATNGTITSLYTFRECLPVGEFLSVLETDIIRRLSRERIFDDSITSQNPKAFTNAPSINLSL
ncbi:unnamed protein product [Rotaria magnacalcarata]|uniref:MULE transposase domain-containing protein n=1 Tax=Rotaria magnacalcarata TaxID=392030 RepID=A0A816N8Q2_9BILA|nr:unnamed protein product [Rotaria magnacalcarata]